jgi:uncharacterized protein YndB with AHSA1/START domain
MHTEAETTIERPRSEVFDYLAHAEHLPQYVTEFRSVDQASEGEPGPGTEYRYVMERGQTEGTFEWTEFERDSKLAWHGPPAKSGPGSMEPSGWWELADEGGRTRVKLVMEPKPGGLFKLMAPLMSMSMRRGNAKALERLKQRLEGGANGGRTAATGEVLPDKETPA